MEVSRVTLTAAATAVVLATTGFGDPLMIRNIGPGTLYVGKDNTVTNLTGFPVNVYPAVACELDLMNYEGKVYGYASGGNCSVAIIQEVAG